MYNVLCADALNLEADHLATLFREAITAACHAGFARGFKGGSVQAVEATTDADAKAVEAWRAFYAYTSHVAEAVAR